ncbi:MAG: hypothetical protein JXA90_17060 [Planctomycetes bacterium]|nr:hypothetical protein [Planctomycetota bacterium]
MKAFDIIAYSADADTWCPECAEEAYGKAALGICPECGSFLSWNGSECVCCHCGLEFGRIPTDSEGNEVHPIFASDEWQFEESGLHCHKCGEEIVPAPKPKCDWCGEEVDREEDLREWPGGDRVCEECYRAELPEVQGSNWLAHRILDWHGGQWSPSYAVGSSWLALREVPVSLAWEAERELFRSGAADVAQALAEFLDGSGFPEGGEPWAE